MFPAVRRPLARSLREGGGRPREDCLASLLQGSPSTAQLEQEARAWRPEGSAPEFSRRCPSSYLAGPGACACAPAPSPGGRRAGREGRAWTPASPEGAAGEGSLLPRPGGGPGPGGEICHNHRSGGDASGGRAARRPFPSCAGPAPPAGRALQLQEIPEALHHPGAARSPGCQGSPKESHMPAGRPRGPPSPPPCPTRPAGRPRSPARHPFPRPGGPAECVAAPAGGYFEREGERPGRGVFGFFPGPRPASPGPRLPAEEGHVEGERRAASIRLRAGEGPRRQPARLAWLCGPSDGITNSALHGRWLQGARYLHAPPPVSAGGRGTPSPAADSGLTG
nr:skin secretory protein xP2-like [Peromyscus maniculatus bairdii]